jgi:phosphoglycerate kinase
VLVRVDFNVPLSDGVITDDTRIEAALPTLKHLLEQGGRVILMSHLGRPKGERKPEFSLATVGKALSEKLGQPVAFATDCIGPEAEAAAGALQDGEILLLENVRYYNEETKNDPEFAKKLASLGEVYVNDAFGTAHRAHASTEGVTQYLSPCVCGFVIEKELKFLGEKTANPERPFVVILGGAKVSDKITVIDALLEKADKILIGGAMAYTFALAKGKKVGDSLAEPDKVETAKAALEKAAAKGVEFLLPVDNLACNALDFGGGTLGETKIVEGDIEAVREAKTVLWNGPMGIFEIKESAVGSFAVAEAVAEGNALSIIGGGDSVKAIKNSGYSSKVDFMSTGGGASLEFLEGKALPGVVALDQA